MSWKISYILLTFVLCSCAKDKISAKTNTDPKSLIEAHEVQSLYKLQDIKLIDFRTETEYNNGHIPGAQNLWRTDIENKSYPYKGIMASKTQIEALFSELGVSNKDDIIIYDDRGMCEATRLWWILENYGFKNIKLLNGGFSAWKAIDGQVDTITPVFDKTNFKLSESPEMHLYISKEQLKELLNSRIKIVDTRSKNEYLGKFAKTGANRPGRIPGSIHLDWADLINFHGDKRLKPINELERIVSKLNINKNDSIVLYCHSGVRSAHTTFVLRQILGYKNVMNYDGSWTEWSYYNELPFENDYVAINKN
ncbi:sulfurtransferase [Winogradskyella alexanderae]|uniref:Sulfurtransferase n=1 Tax=Winogradskyella alexanderae TaxID=2877123 RepID=A0ABS7XW80_9FLAO|nr:rhodanese-like domain-containing protein [Winogradskyella alexanderae]MCA0133659.1 hypothetical protein [Winogradskyella alexanderae]